MQRTMLPQRLSDPLRRTAVAWRQAAPWVVVLVAFALQAAAIAAEETPQRRPAARPTVPARPMPVRTDPRAAATRSQKVDHAVTQAGGGHATHHTACRECSRSACPQCRLAEHLHHGHRPCQHGLCPAHCPVRPDVFGYYGTQWRKWPGSGVAQAANLEAATPSPPPRAEVPKAAEESPQSATPAEDLPSPDREPETPDASADATMPSEIPAPGEEPRSDDARDTLPAKKPATAADTVTETNSKVTPEPKAEPESESKPKPVEPPATEPRPAPKPPVPAAKDLFDDASSSGTSWRSFTAAARRPDIPR